MASPSTSVAQAKLRKAVADAVVAAAELKAARASALVAEAELEMAEALKDCNTSAPWFKCGNTDCTFLIACLRLTFREHVSSSGTNKSMAGHGDGFCSFRG